MCETASERYEHALTVFESRVHQGIPTNLSSICSENRVYYRGILKWLYKSGRNLSDLRKDIKAESRTESQFHTCQRLLYRTCPTCPAAYDSQIPHRRYPSNSMPFSIMTSITPAVKRPRRAPPSRISPFFIKSLKVIFRNLD